MTGPDLCVSRHRTHGIATVLQICSFLVNSLVSNNRFTLLSHICLSVAASQAVVSFKKDNRYTILVLRSSISIMLRFKTF